VEKREGGAGGGGVGGNKCRTWRGNEEEGG
jgi:hypothetical protein